MSEYDDYVRRVSRASKAVLRSMLTAEYRRQGLHVVYGGPEAMSKDELVSALCRIKREKDS